MGQEKENKGLNIASQMHLVSSSLASTQLSIGLRICLFPFVNWFICLPGDSNFSPLVHDLVKFTDISDILPYVFLIPYAFPSLEQTSWIVPE